jgi:hypothetical protein
MSNSLYTESACYLSTSSSSIVLKASSLHFESFYDLHVRFPIKHIQTPDYERLTIPLVFDKFTGTWNVSSEFLSKISKLLFLASSNLFDRGI